MKISVIIPAFNAEKYLIESLESVVNQTINDYEIIVVDDGSTDNTLNILKEYERKYDYFKVISQINSGPAIARNKGIEAAKGKYVFFFDSDDILENDALESLYECAEAHNSDLVIARYDIFNQFKHIEIKNIDSLLCQDKIDKYDLGILWTFSLWNKLFKKEIIDKNNIRFPNLIYSEDAVFLMNFVYLSENITGLDKLVLHYRRIVSSNNNGVSSITATLNPRKINSYITAHNLVLNSAKESFMKDYCEYNSITEAMNGNIDIKLYINEIIQKELQVLFNQFYSKFWALNDEDLSVIVDEINGKIKSLDMKSIAELQSEHVDLSILNLPKCPEEMLKTACFTAVLFGDDNTTEEFLNCLYSLISQDFTRMKIVVPANMKRYIVQAGVTNKNIEYIEACDEDELFRLSLDCATTDYIVFCNKKAVYFNNALKIAFKMLLRTDSDFVCELIYHNNFGEIQPVTLNQIAYNSLVFGSKYNPRMQMDNTLINKFFKTEFLRSNLKKGSVIDNLPDLYKSARFMFFNHGVVIFNDDDSKFKDFISSSSNENFIEEFMQDKKIPLKSGLLKVRPSESFVKLQVFKNNSIANILKNFTIFLYKHRKLKNRTLFFSIRKDGELEGNAKALYPYVKGKKIICARRLPHNLFYELKMIRKIMTSKVVVTDDYVRYIRHFETKPGQKVVQLWHACGAFKKFGRRGTNISINTDLATHAQYNLVCVSGEYVRPVYSDAFDIDIRKVSALGCPSTDKFFDKNVVENVKSMIYSAYPQFKDKKIVVYAPTFRDYGNDRTVFKPEIDFDVLSKNLPKDQFFVICPHPIMKNKILDKKYDNIFVIRDFSTDDIMLVSDMLITDYSSVIFEYSLLNKPIAFYCYDLLTYNRDFYLKYPDDLPGEVLMTQSELINFLNKPQNQVVSDKHELFVKKYMSACDGNSGQRIADLVNEYLGVK